MTDSEQSDTLLRRQAGDDVAVVVTFRRSAFERLTSEGLPVNGMMNLVPEPSGGYAVCVWSGEMPDWPDPVPGNAAAAADVR